MVLLSRSMRHTLVLKRFALSTTPALTQPMILSFRMLTGSCFFASALLLSACGSSGGTTPASVSSSSNEGSASSSPLSSSSTSVASSASSSSVSACSASPVAAETTRIEAESALDCEENQATRISDDSLSGGGSITPTGDHVVYPLEVDTSGHFTLSFLAQADTNTARWTIAVDGEEVALSPIEVAGSEEEGDWKTLTTEAFYLKDGRQVLQLKMETAPAALDYFELHYAEPTTRDPHDMVSEMGIGINLGNTLDAYPNEGDWAPKAEQSYFVAFKEAGFRHVRIPATWDTHTADTPPYAVSDARMDRTEQVVDWALAQGYPVILNAHHEIWLKENYDDPATRERFDAIWHQISERFANKSASLMFEILNEPVGMNAEQVNDLNARILDIIREKNPSRLVVIAGDDYTPASSLNAITLPDDEQLIGNFHSYDPWPFAGECARRWGTDADKAELAAIYKTAKDWSISNDVPVMVNEFGVPHYDYNNPENICNSSDRLEYLRTHVTLAIENGMAASVWDDAESFQVYDRALDSWDSAKDVLVAPNP